MIAEMLEPEQAAGLKKVPAKHGDFDLAKFYDQVHGTNCENVIGFVPIPVGVIGPLLVNEKMYHIPMATTEGALIASTNRGARAIRESVYGARARVVRDGMTRSPCLAFPTAVDAADFVTWIQEDAQLKMMKDVFGTTTNHGALQKVTPSIAGRFVFLRFEATTGDAMGMNMVGKGVNLIVQELVTQTKAELVALSGNVCTDKKPSAVNWTQGRGKSVICETTIPHSVVERVLKTSIEALVSLNVAKNLVGSAMAGSIGGNNAHASNMVTAIFLATGQDPAQNVESSNCMTLMEAVDGGESIHISVTMPSIEVGTVGGGTSLASQRACLEMLGVAGANAEKPGANAAQLSQLVAATVLAGEISLNAALSSNHLISAHMKLNRKPPQATTT